MPAGALRLLLLLLLFLQLGCVTPLRSPAGLRLGLGGLPPASAPPPHRKAPQFMLDLFNVVSLRDGTRKSQKDILEGNTVRSFEDKGPLGEKRHFFNLSSLGREEKLVKAELRWFRKKPKFHRGKSRDPHFYQVDLYENLDSLKPQRGNLLASRLVPVQTEGWEVFNITHTVSKWIQNSQENNGVLLVTTFPPGSWMDSEVSSSDHPGELLDTNTYLVIISDDGRTEANQSHLGLTHTAASPEPQRHLSRKRRSSSNFAPLSHPQSCKRVPLFVDFEEIGWSGWIISPRGYNAYQCKGSCPFPLGVGLRATNHATVRSIMHALKLLGNGGVAPCCVPDRLQPISLLYFDNEENVVLKQFDDMVALSCGCH